MGRFKRRQGVSVDLGLNRNTTSPGPFTFLRRGVDKEVLAEKARMGWLSMVALTLLRPLRSVNNRFQQYRRKV